MTAEPTQPARSRIRPRLILVIALVTAVWIAASAAVAGQLSGALSAAAPQHVVERYLQALVAGRVSDALKLGGIDAKDAPLLTAAAYRASSAHPTAFTITSAQIAGPNATVVASITQSGARYGVAFHLKSVRRVGPATARWELARQTLPRISVDTQGPADATLRIDGVDVAVHNGKADVPVLPGAHAVALGGGAMYTGQSGTVQTTLADGPTEVSLSVEPSQAGIQAAQKAVDAWIDACAASGVLAPSGCPFAATGDPTLTLSNGAWTIDAYPAVRIGAWSAQLGGWQLASETQGTAEFSAEASGGGRSGTVRTGVIPFTAVGALTGFDGTAARFTPSPGYSGTGSASGGLGA